MKKITHNNTPTAKIERTITQDAEEFGIIVKNKAGTGERKSKSGKEVGYDLLRNVKQNKNKSKLNSTIKEESSDDEGVDSEAYKKNKEEFLKQERLFKRRERLLKSSSNHDNSDSEVVRIERIKEFKEKKVFIFILNTMI